MTDAPQNPKESDDSAAHVEHSKPINKERSEPTSNERSESNAYPTSFSKTKSHSNNNWVWVVVLSLISLGIGLFAGQLWGKKQADTEYANEEKPVLPQIATATGVTEVATTQKPVLTVETVTPKQSLVDEALSADGTLSPKTTATVNGKVSGVTIEQVLVQEGDYVKQGQVLAVFDTDAMHQQLIQAQAELAEAQTSYKLARRDAERILPLLDINAISQQEADRYVATAEQAAAAVAASEARLNNQNLNMENAKVTAPINGIISNKQASVGSVPGSEPLFTIIKEGKLEWQAQIDPSKLGEINVGTLVVVSLPNNQSVNGQVSRIAPTAEDGSRQITVYATLENHPNARAGMYQRGTFKLGNEAKVTIPISAVVTQDGYDYVMQVKAVKDEEGNTIHRISRIKVKLGERFGNQVVLLDSLKGKGNIVRQGGSFLNDGDIVRIADDPKATGAEG